MSAVTGIVLFAFAVFVFGVALVAARKPNAPGWLTDGFAGSLIAITTIALAATGLGLVGQFAASYGREALGPKEIVMITTSVMLLVSVLAGIVKALRRSATLAVADKSSIAGTASPLAESAVTTIRKEEGPPMPVEHGPSSSSPTSKRAA